MDGESRGGALTLEGTEGLGTGGRWRDGFRVLSGNRARDSKLRLRRCFMVPRVIVAVISVLRRRELLIEAAGEGGGGTSEDA